MLLRTNRDGFHAAITRVRKQFVKVFFFSLFLNLAVLVVPLYMLQIYDRVLSSQSVDTLYLLTLLAGGLLVAMALVEIARSWLLVQSATWLDGALNSILFRLALSRRLEGDHASASQPMRSLDTVRSFLTGPGLPALFDAPWVPLYLGIIFLMHPLFGAIALFGTLVILVLAILSDFATRDATRESVSAHQTSEGFLDSVSRNSEAIHAMGMVGSLNKLWLGAHTAGVEWQAVAGDRAAVLNSFAKAFRLSLQVAILGTGAWLAIQHVITPGVMIAASIIMSRALAPAEAAIANWRNFIAARHAYARLKEIFTNEVERDEDVTELPRPTGHVEVDKVYMRHPGSDSWLLQDLTFTVKPGETLGVIGPSGIGKTSLIRMLLGLGKPNLGNIRLDGVEVSRWPHERLGAYVGYVPQDVELLVGTIAENISRFSNAPSEEIIKAAKLAEAHNLIVRLPAGYDTDLGESGSKLSGGQRQRIALARALFGDPQFVVLDEPNANLDNEGQDALKHALTCLKKLGRTVVIVSYRASAIANADNLLVILPNNKYVFGPKAAVLRELGPDPKPDLKPKKQSQSSRQGKKGAPVAAVV